MIPYSNILDKSDRAERLQEKQYNTLYWLLIFIAVMIFAVFAIVAYKVYAVNIALVEQLNGVVIPLLEAQIAAIQGEIAIKNDTLVFLKQAVMVEPANAQVHSRFLIDFSGYPNASPEIIRSYRWNIFGRILIDPGIAALEYAIRSYPDVTVGRFVEVVVRRYVSALLIFALQPKSCTLPLTAYLDDQARLIEMLRNYAVVQQEIQELYTKLHSLQTQLANAEQQLKMATTITNVFF